MKQLLHLLLAVLPLLSLNASDLQPFEYKGETREYILHVPSTYNAQNPRGLVLILHGLGGEALDFDTDGEFFAEHGWISILPQAKTYLEDLEEITAWNAGIPTDSLYTEVEKLILEEFPEFGALILPSAKSELDKMAATDDEGFLVALLDSVKSQYKVADDSVFIAGFSMGGFMTHRMLINRGNLFAAGAAVSGLIGSQLSNTQPTHGTHPRIMQIHGTQDEMVQPDGKLILIEDPITIGLSVDNTVEYWRQYNQCASVPTVFSYPDTQSDGLTFEKYTYPNGRDNSRVEYIKANNGEHSWYGPTSENDIDYTEEIYNFFLNKTVPSSLVNPTDNTLHFVHKFLRNGQLLIHRNDKNFTIQGLEVQSASCTK